MLELTFPENNIEFVVTQKSLGTGIGKNLVPEKSLGTGIGKTWYRKKVLEPVSEKFGAGTNFRGQN